MLVVKGAAARPIALIEVPRMGPFMGARAITSRGLGPWLLLARPADGRPVVVPGLLLTRPPPTHHVAPH